MSGANKKKFYSQNLKQNFFQFLPILFRGENEEKYLDGEQKTFLFDARIRQNNQVCSNLRFSYAKMESFVNIKLFENEMAKQVKLILIRIKPFLLVSCFSNNHFAWNTQNCSGTQTAGVKG